MNVDLRVRSDAETPLPEAADGWDPPRWASPVLMVLSVVAL